ncbi:CHAT domain-containing protein [Streptomyces sp. NPDC002926]
MLTESLVALAAAAGTAVVQAVNSEAWAGLRHRIAAWLGRGDPLRERRELERLDRTAAELNSTSDSQARRLRFRLEVVWQTRIEIFVEDLPEPEQQRAAAELRALLDLHSSVAGSGGQRHALDHVLVAPGTGMVLGGALGTVVVHRNVLHGVEHPLVGVQRLPTFWSSRDLPPVGPGRALVLANAHGVYEVYIEPGRPGFTDAAGRRYTSVFAVDVREHYTDLDILLPDSQGATSFRAIFSLAWRVSDPAVWLASGQRGVAALLRSEVEQLAPTVSRRYYGHRAMDLAQDLDRRISQMEPAPGLTVRGEVRVLQPSVRVGEHDRQDRRARLEHQDIAAEEAPWTAYPGFSDDEEEQPPADGPPLIGYPGSGSRLPPPAAGRTDEREPRRLVAELAEQAPPGREVPLQVQIVRGGATGVALRAFAIPAGGARLLITVHAPGLLALGDLQQEVLVETGRDSDVLVFGLRAMRPGLHTVTVRAFRGGSFLGELRVQISVEGGVPTRDGPPRTALLDSLAMDPGEVTLQVLKAADGSYSFQLLSETSYAPEAFHVRAGNPRQATEDIYRELRTVAAVAGGETDAEEVRERLRDLGVALWRAAVPEAVRRQFWQETGSIRAFTVLGEHDLVPWELLYPLDGTDEGEGFLAEWLPIVRRVFGQDRVRQLALPQATFVVPPGSPREAEQEVSALRARFGPAMAYGGTLTRRSQVRSAVRGGLPGLLHFACHNAFTEAGSRVAMADGEFSPRDLSYAQGAGALRATRPLVFFNACRSAGQIDWYSTSMGWAPGFLEAGAGAFVGTLWPVRSDSALAYADAFYRHLVSEGLPLGQASMQARQAIRAQGGDPTWLAYAVYGSPAACATTT